MKHRYLLLLPLLATLSSCIKPVDQPAAIEGYAPIYEAGNNQKVISSGPAQPTVNAGKIYVKGTTLYQVESGKGIHVISIADIGKPTKLAFIKITGCEELSIKDNFLYANNLNDLVVVDISNVNTPMVQHRLEGAFHIISDIPPAAGWFECTDPAKGAVIGWTRKTLENPNCRY
jgi:hypothetical protein